MTKKFVQAGDCLSLTAPSGGVTTGVGYVIGAQFVVAADTVAETLPFNGEAVGVHALAKSGSLTFTQGEKVFWDDSAKACKKTASGYFLIGIATAAVGASDTTINVKLADVPVTAV